MRLSSHHSRSFLASTIVVFLLVFSFNAYACLLPLSGTTDAAMVNGCSTPVEQPARQFCDAFTTLGVEAPQQLHMDHHWPADHMLPAAPTADCQLQRMFYPDPSFESSSPPHQSLTSTVLRI